MGKAARDLVGQRFGRLVVVAKAQRVGRRQRWLVHCDCGRDKEVFGNNLLRGATTSCRCYSNELNRERGLRRRKPDGVVAASLVFASYRCCARSRGIEFALTAEDVSALIAQPCNYCGCPPSNVSKPTRNRARIMYSGIDRVDNARGYVRDNCVPCCKRCNEAKRAFRIDDFLEWGAERIRALLHASIGGCVLRGVDVSAVQGDVPWTAVAASGVRFAYLKCSTGNDSGKDPTFDRNVAEARAAGIAVGAYHFCYPLPSNGTPGRDPEEQAQIAFDKCGGLGSLAGDLPPALDLEWPAPQNWQHWGCSAEQIRGWALAYLARATELWGVRPVLYTYPDFAMHVRFSPEFAAYPLWIADYSGRANPIVPTPWTTWTLRQSSGGTEKLPNGCPVDVDVCRDDAAFATLTSRAAASEPAPASPDPSGPAA